MANLLRVATFALLLAGAGAQAAEGPVPPCAGEPVPPLEPPGHDGPATEIWQVDVLPAGWQPAACSGLKVEPGSVLVAVAARLADAPPVGAILDRLAAVSTHTQIRYRNEATGADIQLSRTATALATADRLSVRPDFKVEEVVPGAKLYMLVDDVQAGEVVYRILVEAAGPESIQLIVSNVSTVRWMGLTVASPGHLASMLDISRLPDGALGYYSLTATALAPLAAATQTEATLVGRAVGWFRFLMRQAD